MSRRLALVVAGSLALPAVLVAAACGRDNALVDGECAPGYVLVGDRCIVGDGGLLDGQGDGSADAADSGDGSGDGAKRDGPASDAPSDAPVDAISCDDGLTYCNGTCVDTTSDPFNCGSCGVICPSLLCANSLCVGAVAGSVVAIGHDYELTYSVAQAKVLANALLLSPTQALKVRSYEQYANASAVANVKAILTAAAQAQNRTVTYTVATQPSDVGTAMTALNTDVLVVYDQVTAPANTLAGVGAGWAANLASFTHVGGIVLVLDGAGGGAPQMPDLLTNALLLDVTADTTITTGSALLVVAPSDAVGVGVVSPYGAGGHSVYFACNEPNTGPVTYVVEDPAADAGATQPVVIHKIEF